MPRNFEAWLAKPTAPLSFFIIILVLSGLDTLSTAVGLNLGAVEVNPLMLAMMTVLGPMPALVLSKVVGVAVFFVLIGLSRRLWWIAAVLVIPVLSVVVAFNLIVVLTLV